MKIMKLPISIGSFTNSEISMGFMPIDEKARFVNVRFLDFKQYYFV